MALISDPDFLIHSLRLNYLRNVDDPYGPRLISLDPSYHSNPYILDAGLADVERWPELAAPQSVPPSDDESSNGPRFGANLKYTTTIMGPSRTGAMGLRVSGKRTSTTGPRNSMRQSLRSEKKRMSDQATSIQIDAIPPTPTESSPHKSMIHHHTDEGSSVSTNGSSNQDQLTTPTPAPAPVPAAIQSQVQTQTNEAPPPVVTIPFIPKFKGAAEMEARRRIRMMNRIPPGGAPSQRPLPNAGRNLNPEFSSSSSSSSSSESILSERRVDEEEADDDDDFDDGPDADDSIDVEPDEFDPEFAASRETGIGIDSNSDGLSLLSGSGSMLSGTLSLSNVGSSLPLASASARNRNRLSPVREGRNSEEKSEVVARSISFSHDDDDDGGPSNSYFEMITPPPVNAGQTHHPARPPKPTVSTSGGLSLNTPSLSASLSSPSPGHSPSKHSSMFARKPVPPRKTQQSALTALLASTSSSSSSNPFTELYSAISARSSSDSMNVSVYFPHAQPPNRHKPMELSVRKDATAEELLGFALWSYWEEGWLPRIDEGLEGIGEKLEKEDDNMELDDKEKEKREKWRQKCSAVGWLLRIAEDDGEVDEDFPPPDRAGKIAKFLSFNNAFAVLEATPQQVQQNKMLDSKIQRRPSRIVIKKKKSMDLLSAVHTNTIADSLHLASSAGITSTLGSSVGMYPSSLGPSSSHGPPMFLRIKIADTADAGPFSTTIQASGGMYMAEVLEAICTKRKLNNSKDYSLVIEINGVNILIPLDRTVKSLQGKRDLMLVKKSMLQHYGVEVGKKTGRTTDPNASIFKRNSEVPEQVYSSVFDYTTAYKRYTVYRKLPMLVTRSARMLAIDGGYIHIMPQANKAKNVFDSGKTSSYDIKSIVACQQSNKNSATFKLVVHRDAERNKRYEFEAESPKIANEIVMTIRSLKTALDKSGTTKQSRRSRHVT
ncbi:stress-activated map kinase interacting protein 1-domain-containing protein [Abortiporus biennis]|nr:stress-activated map kinase interacting protein 1-domain-containing protein [Abortiporus biennis]